jgi:hypothetical protein
VDAVLVELGFVEVDVAGEAADVVDEEGVVVWFALLFGVEPHPVNANVPKIAIPTAVLLNLSIIPLRFGARNNIEVSLQMIVTLVSMSIFVGNAYLFGIYQGNSITIITLKKLK